MVKLADLKTSTRLRRIAQEVLALMAAVEEQDRFSLEMAQQYILLAYRTELAREREEHGQA